MVCFIYAADWLRSTFAAVINPKCRQRSLEPEGVGRDRSVLDRYGFSVLTDLEHGNRLHGGVLRGLSDRGRRVNDARNRSHAADEMDK